MDDQQFRAIAERYVRQQAGLMDLRNPKVAANRCAIVTDDLIALYERAGVPANRIRLYDHRTVPPLSPDTGGADGAHIVALVDGRLVVDLTRRQYDPACEVITVYRTLDEAGRHWCRWSSDVIGAASEPLPVFAADGLEAL